MDCEGSQHRTSILSKVLETRFVRQVPLYMQLKQTQTCTLTHSSFPFDLLFLSLPLHLCSFHHPQSVCSTFKDFFNAWIFSEKGVRFFFFYSAFVFLNEVWCDFFSKICRRKEDKVERVNADPPPPVLYKTEINSFILRVVFITPSLLPTSLPQ